MVAGFAKALMERDKREAGREAGEEETAHSSNSSAGPRLSPLSALTSSSPAYRDGCEAARLLSQVTPPSPCECSLWP